VDDDHPSTDRTAPKQSIDRHPLPPLHAATWPLVDRSPRRLLLLPLGSTEQHGPHLPLDTDTVIAAGLAAQLHRQWPQIGLAPPMPYGASGEHKDFPGTLSIGTAALTAVLVEFVRHASASWEHVLVVNGHGGNADALTQAADLMRYEGRSMDVVHAASGGPRADAHAGYRETSLMLHLAPHSVRRDLFAPGNTAPLKELIPHLRRGGVRAVSNNGILGDPTGATALEGRRIFESMCGAATGKVRQLI
jgi:mycofactocin system creatininase family protein